MADYLKLFMDKRLVTSEAHHYEYIKGRLAAMKIEDPNAYEEYSKHYGVDLDVKVKEPDAKVTIKNNQVVAVKKPTKAKKS